MKGLQATIGVFPVLAFNYLGETFLQIVNESLPPQTDIEATF